MHKRSTWETILRTNQELLKINVKRINKSIEKNGGKHVKEEAAIPRWWNLNVWQADNRMLTLTRQWAVANSITMNDHFILILLAGLCKLTMSTVSVGRWHSHTLWAVIKTAWPHDGEQLAKVDWEKLKMNVLCSPAILCVLPRESWFPQSMHKNIHCSIICNRKIGNKPNAYKRVWLSIHWSTFYKENMNELKLM